MKKFKYFISVPGYYDYYTGVVTYWKEVSYQIYKEHMLKGELVKQENIKRDIINL